MLMHGRWLNGGWPELHVLLLAAHSLFHVTLGLLQGNEVMHRMDEVLALLC